MSFKTAALATILGMNNRLPPDKLDTEDGTFAQSITSADVTAAGTVSRRKGYTQTVAGSDCHSCWGTPDHGFMVDGTTLYRLTIQNGTVAKTSLATVTPGRQFSYADVGQEVYMSNGVQFFRVSRTGVLSDATIELPHTSPNATVVAGALSAGLYRIVVSHVAADGGESGTSYPISVQVTENTSIALTNIPQRAGHTTNVYATPPDGDTFFLVAQNVGSSYTISSVSTYGERPQALLKVPMPAGTIVRYLNGRLLVAAGNVLYYSETWYLGVYTPSTNYIMFPDTITMVEPCQNGFYLSADQTYWIDGDLLQADLNPVLPYKAVLGTSAQVPHANAVWWMSERGAVLGSQDGQVKNLQESTVAVQPALVGASLYREQDGMKQMLSALFGQQNTVMTTASYMEAEIVRKETVL